MANEESTIKIYFRLLNYIKPYTGRLILSVFFMLMFAVLTGALAYLIGPAIKLLFTGTEKPINIVPFDLFTLPADTVAYVIPLAIVFVSIFKGIASFANAYYMGFIGQRIIADLRKELFSHILKLPIDYFVSTTTGQISSRITNDVAMLQKSVTDTAMHLLKQSLTLIALIIFIIGMDWKLALIASVGFPLAMYPALKLGKRMKSVSTRGQMTMALLNSIIIESIKGVRIVKAFGMEKYEVGKFGEENERLTKYVIKAIKVRGLSSPLMEAFGACAFALTILYAATRIANGTLAPEVFISTFTAVLLMYQPLKVLNITYLTLQQGVAGAIRIFEVLDSKSETHEVVGNDTMKGLNNGIELDNVHFSYGDKAVLKGIDLVAKKGETFAIVGSSGSGKTTLVNLLPRFYDIDSGSISIDGKDINNFTLGSLRSNIAVITQEVVLFDDSVLNNIDYGDSKKSFEEVKNASIAANAHGFISKLSAGYDTLIGEGGVRLSGGERQRISIARAILKNAPILIMDEATSSLDTESEHEVQTGLRNLMKGRTVFVIAHRLSTITNADQIIVLKDGKIVESGKHDDLLNNQQEYSRLYHLQFKKTEEAE